jgi:hypothetical protein
MGSINAAAVQRWLVSIGDRSVFGNKNNDLIFRSMIPGSDYHIMGSVLEDIEKTIPYDVIFFCRPLTSPADAIPGQTKSKIYFEFDDALM